jgi:hypothetical protein
VAATLGGEFRDRAPAGHVRLRGERARTGRDLFTGEMLAGADAVHWLREWAGLSEVPQPTGAAPPDTWGLNVRRLVRASDDEAVVERADGRYLHLVRAVGAVACERNGKRALVRSVRVELRSVTDSPPGAPEGMSRGVL